MRALRDILDALVVEQEKAIERGEPGPIDRMSGTVSAYLGSRLVDSAATQEDREPAKSNPRF